MKCKVCSAKLVVKSSIQELCMVKMKISNSWNWIEIQGMTDQKYDVFDNHLAGGVKCRVWSVNCKMWSGHCGV